MWYNGGMEKRLLFLAVAALAATACSIHLPYGDFGNPGVRVILRVEPDDADVLLDGRFVGLALEYADSGSALRLATRFHELTLRKAGYDDEVIDLSASRDERIVVQVDMRRSGPPASAPEGEPAAAEPRPEPASPPEPPAGPVPVALEIAPPEAAIYIDGRFFGLAPESGRIDNLKLAPGDYEFAVFKPGFRSERRRVTVPRQERFTLTIRLEREM